MESIGSIMERYEQHKQKPPPHEKAAAANEIITLLGENKQYDYKYWLTKIGSANYSTVLELVKAAKEMPVEMRGGYITNKLKTFATKKKVTKKKNESTDTK